MDRVDLKWTGWTIWDPTLGRDHRNSLYLDQCPILEKIGYFDQRHCREIFPKIIPIDRTDLLQMRLIHPLIFHEDEELDNVGHLSARIAESFLQIGECAIELFHNVAFAHDRALPVEGDLPGE